MQGIFLQLYSRKYFFATRLVGYGVCKREKSSFTIPEF